MASQSSYIHYIFIVCILYPHKQTYLAADSVGLLRTYIKAVYNGSEPEYLATEPKKCEAVTVPMCINKTNYQFTSMPNQAGHENQEEAAFYIYQFAPLNCYEYLTQFVCSVFLPMCVKEIDKPIPPCRSFCEAARRGCEPIINQIGVGWPDIMWCSRFPEYNPASEKDMCLLPTEPNVNIKQTTTPTLQPRKGPKESKLSKTSNICSSRERRASIVYGHTFACVSEIHRKKGKIRKEKLEGIKHPVTLTSKDRYVIRTLDGRTDYSDSKVVKLVSLCLRVKGARKITTTFTAGDRVVARTVMRINSTNTAVWNNACLCNNLALYIDKVTIQLKSISGLPKRVGMVRNVEALVCERTHHFFNGHR